MTYFQNLELLDQAIDDYALLNKTQRKVLKALIKVNVEDYSIISIKELGKIVQATATPISNAISKLEKEGIIEDIQRRGVVFTGCKIKQSKISEIINRHKIKIAQLENK
jgi:DNA-binding transcriptional regulator YhcF (GntR family)